MNRVLAIAPRISEACTRRIATSQVKSVKPDMTKINQRQIEFQNNSDVPLFLRGGPTDSLLYYATVIMTIGGIALSLQAIYKLATKRN